MKPNLRIYKKTAEDQRLYILEVFIVGGPMSATFAAKNPVISRIIEITGDQSLELLHKAIFRAFDREEEHMYEFQVGGKGPMDPKARRYVLPGGIEDGISDRKPAGEVASTTVGALGLKPGDIFGYWFDFGDDWWHQINVLPILEKAPRGKYPRVIQGEGVSPPQYMDWDAEEDREPEKAKRGKAAGPAKTVPSFTPTIEQVFEEFLDEQRKKLKPRTAGQYEDIIGLLTHHLNGYAYEGLSKKEERLFNKHYNATGEAHREFVQLFGPDKIVENLGMFLGYFMVHKVMAGAELKRAAGTAAKKLSKWLAVRGYIDEEEGEEGVGRGAEAARDLPKAERAARILFEAEAGNARDFEDLEDEDYLDFDHFTIARVEPGTLWLRQAGVRKLIGPVVVPATATRLLQEGWDLSCSLGRVSGKWHIVEMANVYPS